MLKNYILNIRKKKRIARKSFDKAAKKEIKKNQIVRKKLPNDLIGQILS